MTKLFTITGKYDTLINMKKLSIVIPVYNTAQTLTRCFDSILNQSYSNFEVIAVDDGSTDNSAEIIKQYAERDKRFRYIGVEHGGVSRARNKGVELADGEYLQFIDADDDVEPSMMTKLISLMEEHNAELALCRFSHPFFVSYVEDAVYDLTDERQLLLLFQETFAMVLPWNKIWKRSCFTVPYDTEVDFSEDELGNLANLPNVRKVAACGDVLYRYFFAKKEENAEENSCVNNIINEEAFWENRTSFYWRGGKLLGKRRAIIEKAIKEGKFSVKSADDMCYLRLIDYCFWQMPAYIGMGIPEFGLVAENLNIFRHSEFIKGFEAQEKYGFRLKKLSDDELKQLTQEFTHLCYRTYAEKNGKHEFRTAYAFISVFLALFAEVTGELNEVSQNARLLKDMQTSATQEAKYVNDLLKR